MVCSVLLGLLTVHVTARRRLNSKRLMPFNCVLLIVVMCPSWPVSFCPLLSILSTTILSSTASNLFTAFLAPFRLSLPSLVGRTQTVTVNDQSSRPAGVSFGVPQGSVLGPILFILCSAPLSSLHEAHSVSNQSFADDTDTTTSLLSSWSNTRYSPDHADIARWG